MCYLHCMYLKICRTLLPTANKILICKEFEFRFRREIWHQLAKVCSIWFAYKIALKLKRKFYISNKIQSATNIFENELCFGLVYCLSSEKVYIFWEGHKILRNLHCRFVLCSASQIYDGHFTKFCSLLRIYELYHFV